MLERRRSVSMDTTGTTLTPVRLTATTALTGLRVAFSSELARGSMVLGGWGAGVGLMDGTDARGSETLAGVALGAIAADTTVAEAGATAAAMPEVDTRAATPVGDFTVVRSVVVRSTAADFTAERSTVAEASTVAAVMAADTADIGNVLNP